jgi:hypothetical protein
MEAGDVTRNVNLAVIAIVIVRRPKSNITRKPLETVGISPRFFGVPTDRSQRRRLEIVFQRTQHLFWHQTFFCE